MRLLYLDEAGSDFRAPDLLIAGVLVHGDRDWQEVNRRFDDLVERYIEPEDRTGFVFHATDIFHGSQYFDRRNPAWPRPRRDALLADMAAIIDDMRLPVFVTPQNKVRFAEITGGLNVASKHTGNMLHAVAVAKCLLKVDSWLGTNAPDELATVVHEDGTPAKQLIRLAMRLHRSMDFLKAASATDDDLQARIEIGLPYKRIIDTIHFVEKPDSRVLQLADLCAFAFSRALKGSDIPEKAAEIVIQNIHRTDQAATSSGQDSRE